MLQNLNHGYFHLHQTEAHPHAVPRTTSKGHPGQRMHGRFSLSGESEPKKGRFLPICLKSLQTAQKHKKIFEKLVRCKGQKFPVKLLAAETAELLLGKFDVPLGNKLLRIFWSPDVRVSVHTLVVHAYHHAFRDVKTFHRAGFDADSTHGSSGQKTSGFTILH